MDLACFHQLPLTLGEVVLNILCSQSFDLERVQICTCGNTNII